MNTESNKGADAERGRYVQEHQKGATRLRNHLTLPAVALLLMIGCFILARLFLPDVSRIGPARIPWFVVAPFGGLAVFELISGIGFGRWRVYRRAEMPRDYWWCVFIHLFVVGLVIFLASRTLREF
jgi:hypothetical protein